MTKNIKRFYTTGHKIQYYDPGDEGFGGSEGEWKDKDFSPIVARLSPLSGEQRLSADKQTVFADAKLYCDVLDITEADRYVSPDGDVYNIKLVKDPMSWGNHLEIDLEYTGHTLAEVVFLQAAFPSGGV